MRHGDRTPAAILPGEKADYDICNNPHELVSTGGNLKTQTPVLEPLIAVTDDNPFRYMYWIGNCELGQLTNKGESQTHQVGQDLRGIYVNLLRFLPQALNTDKIYVRNTAVWRTRVSAENFLNGLYPILYRSPEAVIEMEAFPATIETISLNQNCLKAIALYAGFTKTPVFLNFSSKTIL